MKAEFDQITDKPVRAVILTHFHADHAYGTEEFIRGREEEVEIYAHDTFTKYFDQVVDVRAHITYTRAVRQFGTEVPKIVHKNAGIGLNLK